MNDIERRRQKIAEAKAKAQDAAPEEGPSRAPVAVAFVFVLVLAGLALYLIHALSAPLAPILPPH